MNSLKGDCLKHFFISFIAVLNCKRVLNEHQTKIVVKPNNEL